MNNFFDVAFDYLVHNEGDKFTDDPFDSGGPTKFGVTKKSYERYLKRPVYAPEIAQLTIDKAKRFYYDVYWLPVHCDKILNLPIAVCVFDSAVLYGPGTASTLAQKALSLCGGTLKFDGVLGEKSIELLNVVKEDNFLSAFHGLLLARIETVISNAPSNERFRKGWTARANRFLTLNNIKTVIDKNIKT